MKLINYTIITITALCLFACSKPAEPVPHYTVSKIFKSDSATTVNVHIGSRLAQHQLFLIASKLKTDSTGIQNLRIAYLLPGNSETSSGEHSYYAEARYIKEKDAFPTDTLKDETGNVFRINIYGLNQKQAKQLLDQDPKEIAGAKILGRFIDDYSHVVIIPFKDQKDSLRIVEIDSTSKISGTIPLRIKDGAIEKWVVSQGGDYMILKDSVLSLFGAQSFGVPFNSIKAGI